MTEAEKLLAAMERFYITGGAHNMEAPRFVVMDAVTRKIVSEHDTNEGARVGRAQAILNALKQ